MTNYDDKTHRAPIATDKIGLQPDGFCYISDLAAFFVGGGGGSVAPTFTVFEPPDGIVGTPYSFQFLSAGSPAPTFAVTFGVLPAGLSLSSSGLLSGTPTTAATSTFQVTASNGVAPDAVTPSIDIAIGATSWTPLLLPALVAWYDASNAGSIHATGPLVDTWDDLSGALRHLTASGAERPSTGVDTVNSKNALKFTGAQVLATGLLQTIQSPRSWFAVVKLANITSTHAILGSSANGGMEWGIAATTGLQYLTAQDVAGIGSGSTNVGTSAALVGVERTDGGAWSFRLNRAADGSGTSATLWSGAGFLRVGKGWSADFMAGDICEIIGCQTMLAGTDLSQLETYLAAKWGTP